MEGTASKEKKTNKKSFYSGLKAEFNKIVWPTREDVGRETVAVLDLVISYGLSFIL